MRIGSYWKKQDIFKLAINRINNILERIKHISVNEKNGKNLKETINLLSDDEVPKQFINSFLEFKNKNKNPYQGLNTY